jgi:lysophospholipase L1-like esterase
MNHRFKIVLFSLLPAVFLFVGAEIVVRLFKLDTPDLVSQLPGENLGLFVHDRELFWSMPPNFSIHYRGKAVSTNSIGLRSAEISEKEENEYRILSLGESSTFGAGVADWETYTHLLQNDLQQKVTKIKIKTINAGVAAYSSFQSLKYLELRGLKLEPDMIIFYHEVNDYLPSALRDSKNNEIGVLKTDKELYNSRIKSLQRNILGVSALYRFLTMKIAKYKVDQLGRKNHKSPFQTIGLPDLNFPGLLRKLHGNNLVPANINEFSVGSRVTETERIENFKELARICKEENIELVIIHPSYASSIEHECVLTRYLKKEKIPYFEAYHVLHPKNMPIDHLYLDSWHPNEQGHIELSMALATYIYENYLKKDLE